MSHPVHVKHTCNFKSNIELIRLSSSSLSFPQAPEVLMHAAQGSAVDWWGLGVLTYELILGRTPFAGEGGKTRQTYLNIMHKEAQFPLPAEQGKPDANVSLAAEEGGKEEAEVSDVCQEFIRALLAKDPRGRAGCRGPHAVKAHPFFSSVCWDRLLAQEPPLSPRRMGMGLDHERCARPPPVDNTSGWSWAAEDAAMEANEVLGDRRGGKGEEEGDTRFDRFDWAGDSDVGGRVDVGGSLVPAGLEAGRQHVAQQRRSGTLSTGDRPIEGVAVAAAGGVVACPAAAPAGPAEPNSSQNTLAPVF